MKTRWLDRGDIGRRDIAGAAAIMEACRAMDHPTFLTAIDWPRLDGEYAAAQSRAVDYEFVRIPGAAPDDLAEPKRERARAGRPPLSRRGVRVPWPPA